MSAIPSPRQIGEVRGTARTLGLEVSTYEIRQAGDIDRTFEALKGREQALYVLTVPLLFANRVRINTLALGARLPTMHGVREYVEAGGLMSYGPNWPHMWSRAADYVDKILRGAKPADIPVEQPTKFDLVVNLTTAKALGLTIPESFLRAVIKTESDFDPRVVSSAGAEGLMQLLPGTARLMGVVDSFDPRQNIMGGARYLQVLARRFCRTPAGTVGAGAGGPRSQSARIRRSCAVEKYGGMPPYETTHAYVAMVLRRYEQYRSQASDVVP